MFAEVARNRVSDGHREEMKSNGFAEKSAFSLYTLSAISIEHLYAHLTTFYMGIIRLYHINVFPSSNVSTSPLQLAQYAAKPAPSSLSSSSTLAGPFLVSDRRR
jgi:hypothetical protein